MGEGEREKIATDVVVFFLYFLYLLWMEWIFMKSWSVRVGKSFPEFMEEDN